MDEYKQVEVTAAAAGSRLNFNDLTGFFAGYLSTWETDLVHDRIVKGAYESVLEELYRKQRISGNPWLLPVLYQHDMKTPIGGFTELREDTTGLYVEGYLDLDTELGRTAFSGLAKGYANGLSIGFRVKRSHYVGNVREILEIDLFEGSIVAFPANASAVVSDVKAVADDALNLDMLARDVHNTAVRRGFDTQREDTTMFGKGKDKKQTASMTWAEVDAIGGDEDALNEDYGAYMAAMAKTARKDARLEREAAADRDERRRQRAEWERAMAEEQAQKPTIERERMYTAKEAAAVLGGVRETHVSRWYSAAQNGAFDGALGKSEIVTDASGVRRMSGAGLMNLCKRNAAALEAAHAELLIERR